MADKIPFELEISNDGELKIRRLTEAASEFGEKGEKSLNKFSGAFETMVGFVGGSAVVGAFKSVTGAASELFQALIVDGVKAAQEQEDAINQLNTALIASGKYSEDTSKSIQDYASSLQATTKYADEAVVSASALIQSLGRLDKETLKSATKSALDLSAALGIDLNSAALIVGKAASGSTGALGRYGIHIKEGATNAETFARALDGINSRFGGAAEAQINTYSGAIARNTNARGENLEQIGNAIIKNQSLINVINASTDLFLELSRTLEENQGSFQDLVSNGVVYLIEGLKYAVAGVEASVVTFLKLEAASYTLSAGISAVTDKLTLGFTEAGTRAQESAEKVLEIEKSIKKIESGDSVLGNISDGLYKLQAAAEAGLGKTSSESDRATNSLKGTQTATEELSKAQIRLGEEGKKIAENAIQKADPNAEFAAKNEALTAAFEQELVIREDYILALVALEQEKNDKISAMETTKADLIIQENARLTADGLASNQGQVLDNQQKLATILSAENLSAKDRTKIQAAYATQSKEIEKLRASAVGDSLGQLASLQSAKTKEIAIVGKAAAIAQATIDTYTGASAAAKAMAGIPIVGPALAIAAAAAFVAGGLFRVAQISGVPLATGITEVPAGYSNDTFAARLSSGERVVDRGTNQDLKAYLAESQGTSRMLSAVLARLDALEIRTVVNIGNRTIVDEVREGLRSGRAIDV